MGTGGNIPIESFPISMTDARYVRFTANSFYGTWGAGLNEIMVYNTSIVDWQGGNAPDPTNWNVAANWNPNTAVPNGPVTNVSFGNQVAANNVVDMISQGQTVGNITFSATTSTTIQSSGGFALTLDNNGSVSSIDVEGTHTISTPVVLDNDATISGTGTLNLTGGISGAYTLNVQSTLTATSIQVDTLTIGGAGATAVPEPSAIVLLSIGFLSLLIYIHRKR